MSRRATLFAILLPLVGCAAKHRDSDPLPVTNAPAASTYSQPSGPARPITDPDPTRLEVRSSDTCAPITMSSSAPSIACTIGSDAFSGGTIALGTYVLTGWTDDASCSGSSSEHHATMSLEQNADFSLTMRWVRIVDGVTTSGTVRLDGDTATTIRETTTCTDAAEDPMVLGYTATPNELVLGEETWSLLT